jgi:putative FmdB family regulatory protein
MPIYEYQCAACGHQFEVLQKVSDKSISMCPDCGKDALKKLISAPAFRLKGSGWYETDFKTGDKKNVHQPDKKGKTDSKKKGESKPGSATNSKKSGNSD